MNIKRKQCKAEDCRGYVWARGYCRMHDAVANPHKYRINKTAKKAVKKGAVKKGKKKLITISKLDAFVWEITSLAYRLQDADEMGKVKCATCNKHLFYYGTGECQMGHFVSRRKKSTKFLRKNQLSQCSGCNGPGNGQQYLMGKQLDLRFGEGTADKMLQTSNTIVKASRDWYKDILVQNIKLLVDTAKKKSLYEWKDGLAKWKLVVIEKVMETYPIVGELELGKSRLP